MSKSCEQVYHKTLSALLRFGKSAVRAKERRDVSSWTNRGCAFGALGDYLIFPRWERRGGPPKSRGCDIKVSSVFETE